MVLRWVHASIISRYHFDQVIKVVIDSLDTTDSETAVLWLSRPYQAAKICNLIVASNTRGKIDSILCHWYSSYTHQI